MEQEKIGKKKGSVRILTLKDCDYCDWLKQELNNENIDYINIDARQHEDFSNQIENKFQTDTYPMVFIDLGEEVVAVIVGETNLETDELLRTFDTIPHLVSIIKSYIK
jgi:glutaredoxin